MDKLTDKTKQWILKLSGRDLFEKVRENLKTDKIDNETAKQIFSFWLNQRKLRHDEPFVKIFQPQQDKQGRSEFIVENLSVPILYWEKYDSEVSVQTINNNWQEIWHKNKSQLQKDVEQIFN